MSEQISADNRAELESYRDAAGLPLADAADEPVHVALAGALEHTLKSLFSRDGDTTWSDMADEFVLELAGRVVFIARKDYDDLVTSRRDALLEVDKARSHLNPWSHIP